MTKLLIDRYSATTTQIEMYFNEQALSVGTGFFWRRGLQVFLVTNWHNVSGKDNLTGKHLSETLGEPNKLYFRSFENGDPNRPVKFVKQLVDDSGRPLWLEHPIHKRNVDVVCLGLGEFPGALCVNDEVNEDPFAHEIAMDAFILGYPHGVGAMGFPLWKRASIASEPHFDIDDLPLFYVDSASAKGMSGSPVILRTSAGRTVSGNYIMAGPTRVSLLGVYSGRLTTKNPLEAQIGRVWKTRVIEEIISQ